MQHASPSIPVLGTDTDQASAVPAAPLDMPLDGVPDSLADPMEDGQDVRVLVEPELRRYAARFRITPSLEQYLDTRDQYPGDILFYQMGDFYELFLDQAYVVSQELQLTLTARSTSADSAALPPAPMCGVPRFAAEGYLAKLVQKGYSVAICEQIEDPKLAKGLVKRAVTGVVTPGTTVDAGLLAKSHNYLGALCVEGHYGGFVWADISTGEWSGVEEPTGSVWQWVLKFSPAELVVPEDLPVPADFDLSGLRLVRRGREAFDARKAERALLRAQRVAGLGALGLDDKPLLTRAAGAVLSYLAQTQKREPDHMRPFAPLNTGACMIVDDITQHNLEIFERLNGSRGRGTLRHVMDATLTPMGGRLLEDRLRAPLRDEAAITACHDAVAFLHDDDRLRGALRQAIKGVFDLSRLTTRLRLNRATPRDLEALRNSLDALPAVLEALAGGRGPAALPASLRAVSEGWDGLEELRARLSTALQEPVPLTVTEGGIFARGYDRALDELIDLTDNAQGQLRRLHADDQERCGFRLKLVLSPIVCYEVTQSLMKNPVPEDFERAPSTILRGVRYTTRRLRDLVARVEEAGEERRNLEYRLFQELREEISSAAERLIAIAGRVAELDFWQSLATRARHFGWVRPRMVQEPVLQITDGRHPVVEERVGRASFVANSVTMDHEHRLCLVTGPNMGGKSTVLRQVAITCLMAQAGSFVPAAAAELGIVDRLFSRVGASDNIAQGQSTFMVEMMETARILRQSTAHSLVILDEIGRGTSTYDGLAIAWAVAEELVQRLGGTVRTLFATHYHELTRLEGRVRGVFNLSMAAGEANGKLVFLHRLQQGPADRSYGVEVGRLAGLPNQVILRARELLDRFESVRESNIVAFQQALFGGVGEDFTFGVDTRALAPAGNTPGGAPGATETERAILDELRGLDPSSMTPLDALSLIYRWKAEAGGGT